MDERFKDQVFQNVNDIYSYILPLNEIKKLSEEIVKLVNFDNKKKRHKIGEKDILLITYADTIIDKNNKSLKVLEKFLQDFIKNSFNMVHILPFYPSSSDGGFAVTDFFKVDKKHGQWNNIKSISKKYTIMVDIILNHASSQSKWFKNFLKFKGEGRDFFLNLDKEFNTSNVIRARSHKLLQKFKTVKGYKYLWCTFSRDQIDFDFKNPKVVLMFVKLILFLIDKDVQVFRFDAVAFIWKRIESNCVNLDQAHAIVRLFRTLLSKADNRCKIVSETNLPFHENLSYFGNSDEAHIIYNFTLAPLIINTLIKGNSSAFRRWSMSMPPAKDDSCYLNFLATHDGVGIRPLEGIINNHDLKLLLNSLKSFGARFTYRKNKNNKLSVYEANISLFNALSGTIKGKDNYEYQRFFCAHAMMLSFEGIPAVYIHSIFGTKNDYKLLKKTKINRSINRHIYNFSFIKNNLNDKDSHISKVFTGIIELIELRKKQKAFHPNATQYTLNLGDSFFGIWRQSIDRKQSIFAIHNVTNKKQKLSITKLNILNMENWYDLISLHVLKKHLKNLSLLPYQYIWLTNRK